MQELDRLTKRLQFSFDLMNKIFNLISEIDTLNGQFRISEKLSPQTIKRLTQSVLVTSSGASNRIEGNKMSDEEVEQLYRELRIKKFKTRDEQEIAGYLELLAEVFSSYEGMDFKEGVILQIHDMMLKYTDKDTGHRGKYKFGPNRVEARDREGNLVKIIFDPTEPPLVPHEMKTLIGRTQNAFAKREIHPLLIIANFIFEYLAIHPFQDGNGRTSRILTNLLLLKNGYFFVPFVSHERLIEERKVDYYIALGKAQQTWKTEHENIGSWIIFFLEIMKEQATQAIAISSQENIEPYLSKIQFTIRELILQHHEISPKEIKEITGFSPETIKQGVEKLLVMGKIERLGSTRAVRYRVKR